MPDLDLAAANVMTDAAVAFARQNGWRIAIAIVDEGGNVVRITRMDECNFLAPDIARGKAVGAAAWKLASVELNNRLQTNVAYAAGIIALTGNRVAPVQGALPIWNGSRCLGAIGVSGARSDEDEAVARAGLRASAFTEKQGG